MHSPSLRITLYQLAGAYRLDPEAQRQLRALAALEAEPAGLASRLPKLIAVLAAALGGFGVLLWIAANWEEFGRFGRFALLQALVLIMAAGAAWRPAARIPLGLLALLGIGGLFAYFGQTYQTGADPWQLFALWALLALPLCLGVRSDVLWTPWAVVAMLAIALWTQAHAGYRWLPEAEDASTHLLSWGLVLLLIAALGGAPRRLLGSGPWSLRTAVVLGVLQITVATLDLVFTTDLFGYYLLGMLALAGGIWLFLKRPDFDLFALCALALGLDSVLVGGLARLLLQHTHDHYVLPLLLLGLVAAGLLALSVGGILKLSKHDAREEHP